MVFKFLIRLLLPAIFFYTENLFINFHTTLSLQFSPPYFVCINESPTSGFVNKSKICHKIVHPNHVLYVPSICMVRWLYVHSVSVVVVPRRLCLARGPPAIC